MSEQKPSDQEIRQMLLQLHDELQRTHALDESERAMMRHLMNDIQAILDQSDLATSPEARANQNLIDRMRRSIDVLEVSHPTVTAMIVKALDTLNIAGI